MSAYFKNICHSVKYEIVMPKSEIEWYAVSLAKKVFTSFYNKIMIEILFFIMYFRSHLIICKKLLLLDNQVKIYSAYLKWSYL